MLWQCLWYKGLVLLVYGIDGLGPIPALGTARPGVTVMPACVYATPSFVDALGEKPLGVCANAEHKSVENAKSLLEIYILKSN